MSRDRTAEAAAEATWQTALNLSGHDRQVAAALARTAEYWQLVDQELRS